MNVSQTARRLALALGPAADATDPWPEDLDRWLRDAWAADRQRFAAWRCASSRDALLADMQRILARLDRLDARCVFRGEVDYPAGIDDLPRPPAVLFVRGRWPPDRARSVAVVGSRAAYRDDLDLSRAIGSGLGSRALTVISGGALGVDAAVHRGALDAGGATISVLGTGIDIAYPPSHAALFERIAANGALVSTFPPGSPPRRSHFPQRNALLVALSRAVIVVTAGRRSGALITARWARTLGLPLAAFAGSAGGAQLIVQGAAPLAGEADVFAWLEGAGSQRSLPQPTEPDDRAVLDALHSPNVTADKIAAHLGYSVGRVALALVRLELAGFVTQGPASSYRAVSRARC